MKRSLPRHPVSAHDTVDFSPQAVKKRIVYTAFLQFYVINPVTKEKILISALADSGANRSAASDWLAARLVLDGRRERYTVEVSGGDVKTYYTSLSHVQPFNL